MHPSKSATLESVASYGNLVVAHAHAKRGKTFYSSVAKFEENKVELLHQLSDLLLSRNYRTSEYRHEIITDSGKQREISKLPYYPDRIVHWAIMQQIEETLMNKFSNHSHASISGRGIHSALYQTKSYLRDKSGTKYCLKLDIRKYFPSVNHTVLKQQMRSIVSDKPLLALIDGIIDSVPDDKGLPIGNYLSQYFANEYLTQFDKWLERRLLKLTGNAYFVRYMDDVVIFAPDKELLWRVKRDIDWYVSRNLYLQIKPNWQIFPVESRGVDFVGYRIYHNRITPRKRNFSNLRHTCNHLKHKISAGKILTSSDRSSIMSHLGWVLHCTKSVRIKIFRKFVQPVIEPAGIKLTPTMRRAYYYGKN